jgi:hypothetical protein
MGFLGIVQDPFGPAFKVPELHVNLWVLPGLLGRHVVFLDVGMHLQASEEAPLTDVTLLIPGRTVNQVTDLGNALTHPHVAQLIFGERVDVRGGDLHFKKVDVRGGDVRFSEGEAIPIWHISMAGTRKDDARSGATFSRWNVQFANPLRDKAYLRLRFQIHPRCHMLLIRGFGMLASRILVDFRVSDLRMSAVVPDGAIYQQALLPIGKLYCYIVLPTRFDTPGDSPSVRYIRIFEGTVWEPYLGRATYLLRPGKLTVYCWLHDDTVTINRPFRAFIDVKRDTRVLALYDLLQMALTVLCTILIINPSLILHSQVFGRAGQLLSTFGTLHLTLSISSIFGAILAVRGIWRRRAALFGFTERAQRVVTFLEHHLYRLRKQ